MARQEEGGRARALAALLAGNVALAFGPWLVRLADVGPVAAAFWRLAIAVPVLLLLAWRVARVPQIRPRGGLWIAFLVGGLFFAADLASWHAGILQTRLANATLFGNVASFLFPVYGFVTARRLPGRGQAIALALATAGIALLMGRSYELSAEHLLGDALCLLAGICYTVYLVAVERGRAVLGAFPVLAAITSAGTIPLLLAAITLGERVLPDSWWPLVLLSFGSQVFGQGMLVYAIGRLEPLVVGLALLVQPVVAAAAGWFAYRERLDAADLAGAILIAVALVLVRREPVRA
jgi:drug/metabolite transporter (DMT)-like permease